MSETIFDWSKELLKISGKNEFAKELIRDSIDLNLVNSLKEFGLPYQPEIRIHGGNLIKNMKEVEEFINKQGLTIARLIPKNEKLEKKFKLGIKNIDEFLVFVGDYKKDLPNYTITIARMDMTNCGGIYCSNSSGTYVELVKTIPKGLSNGNLTPTAGVFIPPFQGIQYKVECPEDDKRIINKVLGYFRKLGGSYTRGYFHFIVTDKDDIVFVGYHSIPD